MKLRNPVFLVVITLVALALAAGVFYRIQQQKAGASDKPGAGDRALSVKTVPVEVRDFPHMIELPGTLEAAHQATITAQASGTLIKQHVQEGDSVRAGQALFSLDARAAESRIALSQASLTGARAETVEAERKLDRLKPLMQSGYVSRQEFDDAFVAVEAARAKAGAAGAELETARLDKQYAHIRAPIAGRVGRISARPGDLVQAGGEPLTTITAPGALDVRASVAQQDWPALAAARARGKVKAEILHATDNTILAPGELVFADAQLDAATGAVPIKVRLNALPAALLPGQGVRMRLLVGVEPGARVVPEAALQHAQDGTYVYVVRDGKAVLQPVTLLRALDGMQAVSGELHAGERVLIEIPKRLKAGSKVQLEGARKDKPGQNKTPRETR